MRQRIDNDWEFTSRWTEEFYNGGKAEENVRIPHTVREMPLHNADHESYQMTAGYRRHLFIEGSEAGRRLFLQFDGAAHIATVYLNKKDCMTHACGYTGFRVEITDLVKYGEDNELLVKLDTSENASIPPFGFVIDYLTYGGIYRDVWLESRSETYIKDVHCACTSLDTAVIQTSIDGNKDGCTLKIQIADGNSVLKEIETRDADGSAVIHLSNVKPWTPKQPKLYRCIAQLIKENRVIDEVNTNFGFRTVAFDENSFLLNGEPYFLRGLNRHQCYPYIGYAASESLQTEDARILKEELGCKAVRTSHYPQSQYFLDACDRLGLLVFTEIPGWQHIGDDAWKEQALKNTEEMILQNRNHPSIFLWGVRINESQDDDDFYRRTNELAHCLDPYRCTSGVRYLENSHLLEDVYSYNDFSHDGKTPGAKQKKDVMKETDRALLITEANGHMFPTKAFDSWSTRQEQALRHARVLDAAMKDHQHAGCFQWCMFDYLTHRDFGSGDRVCYHGVMDAFRNPKTAASFYASQQDDTPVLEIGSSMDIGDYSGGQIGSVYAFTNADEVKLYKNDIFVSSFKPKQWQGLQHGPILIDDFIGTLLESQEGYSKDKANLIHDCLHAAAEKGVNNLPLSVKTKLAFAMMKYHMNYSDAVNLYGKYVGNWGGEAIRWRFDGIRNTETVCSVTKTPDCLLHLDVKVSSRQLHEGDTYDMSAVRIQIRDSHDNPAVYAQLPVLLKIEGAAEIVGPHIITAEGGMTGTYIRTIQKTGSAVLTIETAQTAPVQIAFEVNEKESIL